jgi:hypothetical protein
LGTSSIYVISLKLEKNIFEFGSDNTKNPKISINTTWFEKFWKLFNPKFYISKGQDE